MKQLILIVAMLTLLVACKKKKQTEPVNETFNTTQTTLLLQGSFSTNAHTTMGNVKLYSQNETKTLVFENFKTDSGPDLRVYLSKTLNNADFKEVGVLKSTTGNFNYTIDATINTTDYKYVLIWCEDFSVLFGNAILQ